MKSINLIVVTGLALASTAPADLVLYDSFTYPDGPLVGAPGSPWQAHSGAGSRPIQVTNGAIQIAHGSGTREDVKAALGGGPYSPESQAVLYAGFQVIFTSLPSADGTFFAHFLGAATEFRCRIWASTTNAAPGSFRLGVGNGGAADAGSGQFARDLALNTRYTVVARFHVSTNQCHLWIDPTTSSDPAAAATDVVDPADYAGAAAFGFRQASGGGVCWIDNLRVGTTFDDVAGSNSPPSITAIPDQALPMNSSATLAFSIQDSETAAGQLNVQGTSSNPVLVPPASLALAGTGADRTVTVTPARGQQGTAWITLTVTDDGGLFSTRSFAVRVGYPSISAIPAQIVPTNSTSRPIPFLIGDAETPASSLSLTVSSSNSGLIPSAGVTFNGSGSNRVALISPAAGLAGLATLTITVSDGELSVDTSFVVTVCPQLGLLWAEPFDYPDETSIGDGTTAWISRGGTFGETKVRAGQLWLASTNTEDLSREFAPLFFEPSNGVVLYASFAVNFSSVPTLSGDYFAHYTDDGSGFRAKLFASRRDAPEGHLRLGITSGLSSITTNTLHPIPLATHSNHTVVTRFNLATSECALWVDPTNEDDRCVYSEDRPAAMAVYALALRQSAGIGALTIDDLRVGTAFADVLAPPINVRLGIQAAGTTVCVSWSTNAVDYVLQAADQLAPPQWYDVPETPTVLDGQNTVAFDSATGNRFLRLKKQIP